LTGCGEAKGVESEELEERKGKVIGQQDRRGKKLDTLWGNPN